MTTLDAETYLCEAIESIRAQTLADWELVVVDDASVDGTVAIVERFEEIDPRIRLIRRTVTGGPFVAANEGLVRARGQYIARMDADDVSLPNRLKRQICFLEDHPGLRACAAQARMLVGTVTIPTGLPATPTLPGAIKWGICMRGFLQGAAMIETAAFHEIGGYGEKPAGQDHRLWCELSRRGWLGALQEVVLHYRQHERQISRTQPDRQRSLAIEAVREHLVEITGRPWSFEEALQLWSVGQRRAPFRAGVATVRRFERLWRADESLRREERDELERLTRRLRADHIRETVRGSLSSHPVGRALLRAYRAMRRTPA